jgi:diadenosine tetraphosphatase ApaH/serine/threonine PP2A family protein phosphatase
MRTLILSDIHSNADALSAALGAVRRKRLGRFVVLGDLVGYGPAPNQVVDAVRRLGSRTIVLRGNHDKVVAGVAQGDDFNHSARFAATWNERRLTEANRRFLAQLPIGPIEMAPGVLACHGSPLDEDAYLLSAFDALDVFEQCSFQVAFFGHTHLPMFFSLEGDRVRVARVDGDRFTLRLQSAGRYLINPGSIGQPRDRDPRASFAVFDSERGEVTWRRVRYATERARGKMIRAGLPAGLADRLLTGS